MPAALPLLPTSSVAFVLGLCLGRKKRPETAGQIGALIAELKRRGVYQDMCAPLDPDLVQALILMESMDRGQAWNRGRRPPAG